MSWSVAEIARMSGVTPRTLRHYDERGLLPPAGIRSNGYRFYEQEQLLRLQQILVLRELDLGLDAIAAILDRQTDRVQALRDHYTRVIRERDRLTRVAQTLARTIEELERQEGTAGMVEINRPENLFEGFDPSRYESEVLDDFPDQQQARERSKRFTDSLSAEETVRMQRETTAAMIRMAELMASGTVVSDRSVQAEIDVAYQLIRPTWNPDADAFKKLARTYLDDPAHTVNFDRIAPGLAQYYRDAMVVFADTRLN
ncbi:MerR family transcriptional regulator [Nocardia sp. NPDC060259]|uniref:MerR family transcriptional regulator n=1 Tax=Nocardia sp. NPDC060259 TaxID=3347088 RepID=UPI00365C6539